MSILTLWSESGGVGKTSTTINLGAALGTDDYDVLIVDCDPQPASITDYAGYAAHKTDDTAPTIVDALLDDGIGVADLIVSDTHVDLVPAHESLANLEATVRSQQLRGAEFLLRDALAPVRDEYDYLLIDPPATLNLLVDNALIASGHVLIPVELTRKGERAVEGVVDTVTALEDQLRRAQPDFALDILGVLPNKVENSVLNNDIRDALEDNPVLAENDVPVLPVEIPAYNVLESTWDAHLDIFEYADHNEYGLREYQTSLLDAYRELAEFVTETVPPEPAAVDREPGVTA